MTAQEADMDGKKVVIATSITSALIVLIVAAPLGYIGFTQLDQKISSQQKEIKSVVIELKSEALSEIKTVSEQVAKELKSGGGGDSTMVSAEISALAASLDELRAEQQKLTQLVAPIAESSAKSAAMVAPGSRDDRLNLTVYFPLGKIQGPMIHKQVAAIIPQIVDYAKVGGCTSNVIGFSDTLGGDKANLALSEKRAQHVAALLRKQDIPIGNVKGWGERWLDVHTVDGVKNEKNRRVVIETHCEAKAMGTNQPSS